MAEHNIARPLYGENANKNISALRMIRTRDRRVRAVWDGMRYPGQQASK